MVVLVLLSISSVVRAEPGLATNGFVASANPLATRAGLDVLKSGGNAIDAAVAVGLTLGVVDTHNSGLGGGCFMLLRTAGGECVALDGRETAPLAATRDMFVRHDKPDPALSQTGALASGVPGSLAVYDYALQHYGNKTLKDVLLPAATLAEKGFPVSRTYAARLESVRDALSRFPASSHIFLHPNGQPFRQGEILKQPDLAATYRAIAKHGIRWFYGGPFAEKTARWMSRNGGLLTVEDFKKYRMVVRTPIQTTYRGWQVISFPPPSSGGVHVAEMLNILETFDLSEFEAATRLHVIAEAMKLAFADRAYWLGDPDFVPVPRGLVEKSYGRELARRIDLHHAINVPEHGTPPDWQTNLFKKHTTHFSVADAAGNWVACTATINTSLGSKVVVPGTGVVLNNQMDDFSIQPGVANYFGLIGAEANAVAPGKRPLSSMSPTMVLQDGKPILALGAAGGPKIISQVLLQLIDILDLGMTPAQAIAEPRVHHQWAPRELFIEKSFSQDLRRDLEGRGHTLKESESGTTHMVARTPDGKAFIGAADPRAEGSAEGW